MSKTYVTIQGDMWDSIAYSQLGDSRFADALMAANTDYRDVYVFSAGVRLVIPDVETTKINDRLPPWKQVRL